MRYLFMFCLVLTCAGLATHSLASPSIEFEKTKVDAGDVCPGREVRGVFIFKNSGDQDLAILSVDKACDCTVVNPDSTLLKPGESSKLELVFTAPGVGGRTSKSISMISNDEKKGSIRLELTANVIPVANCNPQQLNFGSLKPGAVIEKSVSVTPVNAEGFKIEAVKCAGNCVSVPEFRPSSDGKGSYSLKVVIKAGSVPGRVLELVRIKSNVDGAEVPLLVFGNVVK